MKFLAFSQRKILGSSLVLPANGLGGSRLRLSATDGQARATSSLVAHFALQNTKFGSEKGKVQNPARIPPRDLAPRGREESRGGAIPFPQKNSLPRRVQISFQDFRQKKFEHQSKNTAKNHISKNQGWKPRRFAPRQILTISQKVKIGGVC